MSNLKDELEHFKKRVEHAIIGEYEWFVSWSAENIETDLKEHFEAKETELNTTIKRHENMINTLENQVEEMQKAFATIHGIASETFESCNQLELIRLTAVEHLKGAD